MQGEGVLLFMQFLGVLFIIFLAYVGTRWISKKYSNISTGNQMKVLERISLGQDKSIVLVMVGKKAYLLGVSAKGIDILRDFEEGEFTIPQQSNFEKTDFSVLLNDISKKCGSFGSNVSDSLGSAIKDFFIKNGRNGL